MANFTRFRRTIPAGRIAGGSPQPPRRRGELAGDGARHAAGRGRLRGGRLPDEVGARAGTVAQVGPRDSRSRRRAADVSGSGIRQGPADNSCSDRACTD